MRDGGVAARDVDPPDPFRLSLSATEGTGTAPGGVALDPAPRQPRRGPGRSPLPAAGGRVLTLGPSVRGLRETVARLRNTRGTRTKDPSKGNRKDLPAFGATTGRS